MAVMFLGTEYRIGRVARLPRLPIGAPLASAWRADTLLRALEINRLQTVQYMMVGYLAIQQGDLLGLNLLPHVDGHAWMFLPGAPLEWMAAPLLLLLCCGHLGGRVTGWPWRRQPAPPAAVVINDETGA